MPKYGTVNPAPFLGLGYPLNQYIVFNAETITTGEFSERVGIPLGPVGVARGIRVELDFNTNPGTYEIDVMESDTDTFAGSTLNPAANYQQVPTGGAFTTVTTGANGPNTHQGSDQIPFAGQFCLLYVKTAPSNACTLTARITRAA